MPLAPQTSAHRTVPPAGQSRLQAPHFSGVECYRASCSRFQTGGSVVRVFLLSAVGGPGKNGRAAPHLFTNLLRLAGAHRIGGLFQNDGENPETAVECSECSKMADSQLSLVLSPPRKDHWTHRLAAGCKKSTVIGRTFGSLAFQLLTYQVTKFTRQSCRL